MKIQIAAIGRLKKSGESELCERYLKRLNGIGKNIGFGRTEILESAEAKGGTASVRRNREAERLLAQTEGASFVIALDENGRTMSSKEFANTLAKIRDAGHSTVAFLIGGPDGHGDKLANQADLVLSLSPMTLPHGLARTVLLEQLYRTGTILAGHPYHRQ